MVDTWLTFTPRRKVGNQQKWDTLVMKRLVGCGSVVRLPALPVVTFPPLYGLSFHLPSLDQDSFRSPEV